MQRRKIFRVTKKEQWSNVTILFDLSSPVSKLRRTVHHDHKYQSSPTIIRRRLFDCEQRLKEKEKKIKLQKRKINRLQKKV
ncbi:hypothetical protein X777_00104 [Ooceraea biroi]|uniref:Uncharacterized protein n=1 Tax=Ooceraea biroi TaxID=2015173 RepID=A0A026VRY8_OOCBI|nr:hypothetical protein X777_00104 [Ooceraea biroi]